MRFVLIGCGKIALQHVAALTQSPSARIVGVADVSPEKAKAVGEPRGIPWYTDYVAMLKEVQCDVVCILTPTGTHAEIAHQLLPFGKPLVIEKPMTLQLAEANSLLKAAGSAGVKIFAVHQYRFHPPVQLMHQAIQQGRLGKIHLATARLRWCRPESYYRQGAWRATWAMDGGVISNQAVHQLDLLQWLAGPVYSVKAWGSNVRFIGETEDVAVVVLQFEEGTLGVLEATTCVSPYDIESSVSVLGDRGTVEVGGLAANQLKVWAFLEKHESDQKIFEEYGRSEMGQVKVGHLRFYEALVQALRANAPFELDGQEAKKTVEIISAIYESMETGQEVHLRFKPKFCRLGSGRKPSWDSSALPQP